ncbi:hypothetical protein J3Q64DRAFT_1823750 [Phycomyces blakesleeanus]|uniref:Uncharacterized protein n=1 Tax=Phycomyces blakesleeanus TaxID=4837 RepID=A0ABR3ASE2_PHYBL
MWESLGDTPLPGTSVLQEDLVSNRVSVWMRTCCSCWRRLISATRRSGRGRKPDECWIGLHGGFREAPISLTMAESLLARTFAKGEPTRSEAVATATGCNILSLGWRDKVTGIAFPGLSSPVVAITLTTVYSKRCI